MSKSPDGAHARGVTATPTRAARPTTGLFSDLYELRMAASYQRRGLSDSATFSLFVRDLPPRRGFLVSAGIAEALDHLEAFSFDDEQIAWLGGEAGFDDEALSVLRDLCFAGDVFAVPEGRVVFADEPLVEVTAPLPQAQAVETGLLNAVTHATVVASKAARCRLAAGGADLIDFAARRTHGRDAARTAARVSAIVGFAGTSDVEAAELYDLRAVGTMAHSYIEAFGGDRAAFRAFAADFPDAAVFLVDTYETASGVRAAVDVIRELDPAGEVGIRLDSGDLAELARDARRTLDDAGLRDARIMASGGLDEAGIADLVSRKAPIDTYAVGTRMGVSADAPSLDSAYKLVDYAGRPMMKLSPGKCTLPSAKQVFRDYADSGADDVLALRDEAVPRGREPLLVPVMRRGTRTGAGDDAVAAEAARARFESDLAWLPEDARRLDEPAARRASRSTRLEQLRKRTAENLGGPPGA